MILVVTGIRGVQSLDLVECEEAKWVDQAHSPNGVTLMVLRTDQGYGSGRAQLKVERDPSIHGN